MSGKPTGSDAPPEPPTDWPRQRAMTDADIAEDPDAPLTDEAFWQTATLVPPARKQTVTLRLDADLLAWLRRERGYQTRINTILRTYMRAHSTPPPTKP